MQNVLRGEILRTGILSFLAIYNLTKLAIRNAKLMNAFLTRSEKEIRSETGSLVADLGLFHPLLMAIGGNTISFQNFYNVQYSLEKTQCRIKISKTTPWF